MRWRSPLLLFVLFFSLFSFADTVHLVNGDRLTGQVLRLDSGKVVLHTDYAGDLQLDWKSVLSIEALDHLVVRHGNQSFSARTIEKSGDNLFLANGPDREEVAIKQLASIRSEDQQRLYERLQNPTLKEDWVVNTALGFALARGNSDTTNLSLGFDATRKTMNDQITANETSIYATDNAAKITTANANRGLARYDHNVSPKLFVYGSGQFESDAIQLLNLRSILGSGFGWHVINTPTKSLNLLGGLAYTHESYEGNVSNNFTTLSVAQELNRQVNRSLSVNERVFLDSYLNQAGDFRTGVDFGITSKFSRLFTWTTKVTERYVTNPLAGTRRNDVLVTTGLGISLNTVPK